jgi:YfiH family protein
VSPPVTVSAEVRREGGIVPCYDVAGWNANLGLVAGIAASEGRVDYGLSGGRPIADTLASWRGLLETSGAFTAVAVSRQVHGARVARYRRPIADGLLIRDGFDGHVTDMPGLLLAVTVADCVPVFLADVGTGAIGLLHAGWRGIAAGILEAGVHAVTGGRDGGTADIVMHCGIAICGSCYEVGPEVVEAVDGRSIDEPQLLDLRGVLVARAHALGIGRLSVSSHCTAHDEGFASYRAQGTTAGRMAAFLGRPPA